MVKGAFTDSNFDGSGNLSTKGIVMCLRTAEDIADNPEDPFMQSGIFYNPTTGKLDGLDKNKCLE